MIDQLSLLSLPFTPLSFLVSALVLGALIGGAVAAGRLRSHRPRILQNLPKDVAAAREAFCQRIAARYAPGMTESGLVAALTADGFRVDPGEHVATRVEHGRRARRVWKVIWQATGGRVIAVRGAVGVSAL